MNMLETQNAVQGRLSVHALLRKVLEQQGECIQQCRVGAIDQTEPEFTHDLRVAVRRVRVALKLLHDIVECDIDRIRDGLGSIGNVAGVARDCDVFAERLSISLHRLSLATPASELLVNSMAERRAQAYGALSNALKSRTYEDVLAQLASLRDDRSGQEAIVGRKRIRRMGHRVCSKKLARVLRWQRKNVRKLSDEDLHELRRQVKELRYSAEFFADFLAARSQDCLRVAVVLQDCLGSIHDFVVANAMLWELSKSAPNGSVSEGDVSLVVDSLERLWRNDATHARERFFEVWEKSSRRLNKLRRSIAKG